MQYNRDILKGGVSMRPHGSPKLLEERRHSVVTFLKQKLSLHEIARRIGCHASSVMRWRNAFQSGGQDALKGKPASGRPPRLTLKQKKQLVRLLTLTPDVNSGHEIFFMQRPALHRIAAHREPGIGTPAVLAVFGDCRRPRCTR